MRPVAAVGGVIKAASPRLDVERISYGGNLTATSNITTTTTTTTTKKNIGNLFNNVEDITRAINNLNNLVSAMGNGDCQT